MTKFSIIMPVYNVADYLLAAIQSVLSQNVDLELIIVDDGSTDASPEIMERFSNDNRVTVIHTENSGLSMARNNGIPYATGDYIYFMDSDDILRDNFLIVVSEFLDSKQVEGVSFSYQEFNDDEIENLGKEVSSIVDYKIVDSSEALEMLMDGVIPQMAWSYIVKRNVFTKFGISYTPGVLFEDNNSAPKILAAISKFAVLRFDVAPYLLRERKSSITAVNSKTLTLRALKDENFVFSDAYEIYSKQGLIGADLWFFRKIIHLYIKYKDALRGQTESVDVLKGLLLRAKKMYPLVKTTLSSRDKWRFLRARNDWMDFLIRKIIG